jgi:hypothetical protein
MWRYIAGGVSVVLLITAGIVLYNSKARPSSLLAARPAMIASAAAQDDPLPDSVPEATERTREQKRFDRYDKDRNGTVTREEYLAARRKAFAKLDVNHDGTLSFDEWAVKAETKFAVADKDKSGAMNAAEFATTAVKRKPKAHTGCPPAAAAPRDEDG